MKNSAGSNAMSSWTSMNRILAFPFTHIDIVDLSLSHICRRRWWWWELI